MDTSEADPILCPKTREFQVPVQKAKGHAQSAWPLVSQALVDQFPVMRIQFRLKPPVPALMPKLQVPAFSVTV